MSEFLKMATLDELPPGGAKEFEHEGRIYALFNVDGVISCIDGFCPHEGGPLAEGEVEGTVVTCPWHGWRFDVRTGATPMGPNYTVDVFEVKIDGDDVLVALP